MPKLVELQPETITLQILKRIHEGRCTTRPEVDKWFEKQCGGNVISLIERGYVSEVGHKLSFVSWRGLPNRSRVLRSRSPGIIEQQEKILEAIENLGLAKTCDVYEATDMSQCSIRRCLNDLEAQGVIEKPSRGYWRKVG